MEAQSKPISLGKKILFYAIGWLFILFAVVLIGEVVTRLYFAAEVAVTPKKDPPPPYNTAALDDKLGWKSKGNYSYEGKMKDQAGVEYLLSLSTDENGFRLYGNPKSGKKKVFFLGDSYVQSVEVSDDKTFYRHIKDSLDVEVFAYGMSGFGTLQEYLVLEKFVETIQPDILVVQTCSNDFLDNHAPLEQASNYRVSVGKRRPYLDKTGSMYYHDPKPSWENVQLYSKFLAILMKRWNNVQQNTALTEPAEKIIVEQGRKYELYDYAVDVTEQLFQKIADKAGSNTKIIIYDADHYQPYVDEYQRISTMINADFTNAPAQALVQTETNGTTVRSSDGYHWNETGHQVVSNAMIEVLLPVLGKE